MKTLTPEQIDNLITTLTGWLHIVPMISTLLILIGLDVLTGILVAAAKRKINSTVSFRGLTRKALCIILVGTGAVLEPFAQGLPLAQIIALFYCGAEALSIVENCAALGVPIPNALLETLSKLKDDEQKRLEQKTTPTDPKP